MKRRLSTVLSIPLAAAALLAGASSAGAAPAISRPLTRTADHHVSRVYPARRDVVRDGQVALTVTRAG